VDGKKTLKPSLAETIQGLTLQSIPFPQDQLDDEIRKDVLKMFTTGISLNSNVFNQRRILAGARISGNVK
jgi:hypothetical protein